MVIIQITKQYRIYTLGSYAIHIMQNQVPGDTSTALICYELIQL